jgi:hypothetical protein
MFPALSLFFFQLPDAALQPDKEEDDAGKNGGEHGHHYIDLSVAAHHIGHFYGLVGHLGKQGRSAAEKQEEENRYSE